MSHDNTIKAMVTVFLAALSAYFSNIMIPLFVLVVTMVLDYATGMTGAWMHRELSSHKGIQGIVKKVSYFVVIAVAMVADYLIISLANQIGLSVPSQVTAIALVVTIWLILNECISILENLDKIGTPMPSFLKKLIERLKQKAEQQGEGEVE